MINQVFRTNQGHMVTVIAYRNSADVTVQFECGHVCSVRAQNLRKGRVAYPYHPSVHGKGYLGVGRHKASLDGEITPAYTVWKDMLHRAYSPKFLARNPSYDGTTVCESWLDFQTFADWYVSQRKELVWQLDKDILSGDKHYSPLTCRFVPQHVNSLMTDHGAARGALLIGVTKYRGRYRARLRVSSKRVLLGTFDTELEAHEAWAKAKIAEIHRVVSLYSLDDELKQGLLRGTQPSQ